VNVTISPTLVTSTANSGPGSLRDIVSCAAPGATIYFDGMISGSTITLLSEIAINKNLTIAGPGINLMTLSGGGTNRIFNVATGKNLTLLDLSLKNGYSLTNGGAILNAGNLTLDNMLFDDNFEDVTPKSLTTLMGSLLTVLNNVTLNQ
jgi:hypothetical protein